MARKSSELKIEHVATDSLVPYARNPRTHTEAQVAQIAASIREFGWTNPLLIDEQSSVIAGHGRLSAARKLGLSEIPAIRLTGLTEAQKRALVIADNKLAMNAGWDDELLRLELEELQAMDFDIALTGFGDMELSTILGPSGGLTDEDDAPEPPADPVTRTGDLWLLGRHRLLCGDSTSADDVGRVLGNVRPHLMVTDPPYGVEYDANWRNEAERASGGSIGARATGRVANDDRVDWGGAWSLFPGDVAYVWHADRHASAVQDSLEGVGLEMRCQIVWRKSRFVISRGHYHWQHEPCWYAVRKGATGHWVGDRSQSTVWDIDHAKSETGHSTQKPVECMRRPIVNNSSPGQAVYEPFSGSGTTIIAAETTGRACHAIEIDPAYVDVAVKRWQAFTGNAATLDGDGRTFDEVASAGR
jgi:DNA modification methylase